MSSINLTPSIHSKPNHVSHLLKPAHRDRSLIWICLLLLTVLLVPHLLRAEKTYVSPEYLTIDDGLSDNYITQILQDRYGYLWFGTMDGLNRYDGRSFIIFRNLPGDPNSLSDNHIKSVAEDEHGNLFIATHAGGLNIFERATERFKRVKLQDSQGTVHKALASLECATQGIIWVGTQDGYLLRYDPGLDSVEWSLSIEKDFENLNSNLISDMYPAGTDSMWIASGLGGLDLVSYPQGILGHILLADTLDEPFRRNGCVGIVEDAAGLLWISRVSGLDSYDPETGDHQHFGFLDAKAEMLKGFNLLLEPGGDILLNSYYDLIKFDPQSHSHELITSILPRYFTPALFQGSGGILWSGTMGYGAVKLDPRKGEFHTESGNYLPEIFPTAMALLADSTGLDLGLRDRNILSVIRDRQGQAWVATQYWGLYCVDESRGEIRRYTLGSQDIRQRFQVIYQVFEDRHGDIWVSTVGGLCKLDQVRGHFQYHRLYPGTEMAYFGLNKRDYLDISCIHQDRENVFWLGTPELGLIRYNPSNDSLRIFPIVFPQDTEARSFSILAIAEDPELPDQVLWLGTEGGGLVRFDKEHQETIFLTTREGLPNNMVNSILPGNGATLWLSSNMGLSRFTPATGQFLNFDVRDGLQSNGFNRREGYRTAAGELYFGGTYGYNHFFPETIGEDLNTAPIVLTGIDIFNEALNYGDPDSLLTASLTQLRELSLDHSQGMMVTFYFTALNYSNPHRDQFAYKLENFDERWIRNGVQRSAVYTNLNPGNYRFHVRYVQELATENPPELTLDLTIRPPYWKTWWFRTLVLVTLFGVAVLLMRRQLRHLERKRLQQQHFSQQLLTYQEEERKRISGELHDGIGQDLLIIKNTLQLGLNNLEQNSLAEGYFSSASDTVSQTIQEVREISHNLSPQHLERLGLAAALENMLETVELSTDIHFDVDIDEKGIQLPAEQEIHLYRIAQEAVNNLIKHSQATQAWIRLDRSGGQLIMEIGDNGQGIPLATQGKLKGIGLAGMQERAQLLQAEFGVRSNHPQGTVIVLKMKLELKNES